MSRTSRVLFGLTACFGLVCLPACESKVDTSNSGKEAPHKGQLIPLNGVKGYIEVVTKPGTDSGKTVPEYSFYVVKEDYSDFSPAPTTATLTVGKKTATLKADGGALVVPAGQNPFTKGGLDGNLTVEIEGKPVVTALGVR